MSDRWTDRLSEYIDATLSESERIALESHLASCAGCRTTLTELRRVVARAGALDDRPPAADLWPAVAARIGRASAPVSLAQRRARRRISFTVPQLAAAAVALALLSGASAWLTLRQRAPSQPSRTTTATPLMTNAGTYPFDQRYAAAVADLERVLAQSRGRLDTATVRVIEKNLGIIDRAIRDAQSALAADPANTYLNLHLAQEMRRKLELLRQAATLAGART
ncbi:MAG TPA: zf-HC2 domain-containing protein [Gaiellales bacterium]|nr:zf-HC2 domain-containing protein [Gaiellales bacterium]